MKLVEGGETEMAKGKEEESVGGATVNKEKMETKAKAKANEEENRQPREGMKDTPWEKYQSEEAEMRLA